MKQLLLILFLAVNYFPTLFAQEKIQKQALDQAIIFYMEDYEDERILKGKEFNRLFSILDQSPVAISLEKNKSRKDILGILDSLQALDYYASAQVMLIFYGLGSTPNGEKYFLCADTDVDSLASTAISHSILKSSISAIPSNQLLVLMDAQGAQNFLPKSQIQNRYTSSNLQFHYDNFHRFGKTKTGIYIGSQTQGELIYSLYKFFSQLNPALSLPDLLNFLMNEYRYIFWGYLNESRFANFLFLPAEFDLDAVRLSSNYDSYEKNLSDFEFVTEARYKDFISATSISISNPMIAPTFGSHWIFQEAPNFETESISQNLKTTSLLKQKIKTTLDELDKLNKEASQKNNDEIYILKRNIASLRTVELELSQTMNEKYQTDLKNFPRFDFPPPEHGKQLVLESSLFESCVFLGDMNNLLTRALKSKNYPHKFYQIPKGKEKTNELPIGFAIVAQLENIDTKGKALAGKKRFSPDKQHADFSFAEYFKTCLGIKSPESAHSRMVVFLVSSEIPIPISEPSPQMSMSPPSTVSAIATFDIGSPALHEDIANQALTNKYKCYLFVYDFEYPESGGEGKLEQGGFTGEAHYELTGLKNALEK